MRTKQQLEEAIRQLESQVESMKLANPRRFCIGQWVASKQQHVAWRIVDIRNQQVRFSKSGKWMPIDLYREIQLIEEV